MAWTGKKPSQFTLDVLAKGDETLRKISGEMLQQLVILSPVDSGAYRGNHRISINSVDNTSDTSKTDISGNATLSEGVSKIAQAKFGDYVMIQNNLKYAKILEDGHSQQAPLGIYSIAFLNVTNKYK